MKLVQEFRAFVARGNAIDLAVGVIIGAAFGKIVSSLVKDIVMPPIGMVLGGIDFSEFYVNLSGQSYASLADAQKAGAATINVGVFVNVLIEFLIVALAIFVMLRVINKLQREPPPDPTTKDCPYCLSSIPIMAVKCAHCTSNLEKA
jgi:large conductance mechanosensitive channel